MPEKRHQTLRNTANLKYIKGVFNPNALLAQLLLDTLAVILKKKSEIVGENFFQALKKQFWSILLKYQETDVQIQTFTGEN